MARVPKAATSGNQECKQDSEAIPPLTLDELARLLADPSPSERRKAILENLEKLAKDCDGLLAGIELAERANCTSGYAAGSDEYWRRAWGLGGADHPPPEPPPPDANPDQTRRAIAALKQWATALAATLTEESEMSAAATGQGEGDAGESKQPAKATIPDNEAQIIVRDYIKKREDAGKNVTSRDVSRDCGIAQGRVPQMTDWQAYQARKTQSPPSGKRKQPRPLTGKMLAAIGKESDPSANAESTEETAWRYLLENAKTPEERARLNAMTAKEKAEAIQLAIEQIADQDET